MFGYVSVKKSKVAEIEKQLKSDKEKLSNVRSLLWQIGNHGEKVAGTLRLVIKELYPDYNDDDREKICNTIGKNLDNHCWRNWDDT